MEKFFAHFGVMPDYIWFVDKKIDLALPLNLPGGGDKVDLILSVCNEALIISVIKSNQQIYQKTVMLVNKCYYKYLKKYYGKKDRNEILEMVMIEMSIKRINIDKDRV